jgi:hypothetical protein
LHALYERLMHRPFPRGTYPGLERASGAIFETASYYVMNSTPLTEVHSAALSAALANLDASPEVAQDRAAENYFAGIRKLATSLLERGGSESES